MAMHGNRVGWALFALLVGAPARAAQRTVAVQLPAATTLAPVPSLGSSFAKERETPPPALLPAPELAVEVDDGIVPRPYAMHGVVEIGGFASLGGAGGFTSIRFGPTAGMFLFDGFELSVVVALDYLHRTVDLGTSFERVEHETIFRLLGEPSYHLPLTRTLWAFCGIGLGVARVPRPTGGAGPALDLAPRLGVNVLVGRMALLTPAAFFDYATGATRSSYGMQAGYAVTW
jgi:hypothetical protein